MSGWNQNRFDSADGLAFLREQLRVVSPKVFERKIPAFKSQRLIPTASNIPAGAEEVSFTMVEAVGEAQFKNANSDDMPWITMASTPYTSRISHIMLGFRHSFQAMRQDEMAGLNLLQRSMTEARKGHEVLHDKLAWVGSAAKGIYGLVNNPNVPRLVAANALSSASTGDQMYAVLLAAVVAMQGNTNGVEVGNTLALPVAQYLRISATPMNSAGNASYTVLDAFRKAFPEIDQIESVHWLSGQGDAATDVMVLYNRDPMNLEQLAPLLPEFGAPQPRGVNYEIPGESRHGGTVVHYPMSVLVVQGI